MKFSILCPTRNRATGLRRMIESVVATTESPKDVEIIIMYDDDDKATESFLRDYCSKKTFSVPSIRYFARERSMWLARDYYGRMAELARGEFLWGVGDDVEFLTKGWDVILSNRIESYLKDKPDRVVYVSIEDSTPPPPHSIDPPPFCCFPIISKSGVEGLGFLLHYSLATWGADYTIYLVYSHEKVRRVLSVDEVVLDHISYHSGRAIRDGVSLQVEANFRKNPGEFNRIIKEDIGWQASKLQSYISSFEKGRVYGKDSQISS